MRILSPDRHARSATLARPLLLGLLVVLLAGLTACASTRVGRPTAAPPTATPAVAPGTILFHWDWSKGLDGWRPSAGWTARDGALEMDGQDNRTLVIPYQPRVRDYAVIFSVQVVNEPKDGGYFRLLVAPTPTAAGFYAEVEGLHTDLQHMTGDHPHARVVFDPYDAQNPASGRPIDYEPQHAMVTYRVEVRENNALFATDHATLTGAYGKEAQPLSQGPLTLACGLAFLRFGSVSVIAL